MREKNNRPAEGFSLLIVVLVIATMLAVVLYVLQANSVLQARRASQTYYGQAAFSIAEGITYRTLDQYAQGQFPPDTLPITDSWQENNATIKRAIYQPDSQDPVTIEITATVQNTKRKLVATFTGEQSSRAPIEAVLIIDASSSMYMNLDNGTRPIDHVKQAAISFVQIIDQVSDNSGPIDRISLVIYGDLIDGTDKTAVIHPLNSGDNYQQIIDLIESIGTFDPTTGGELYHYQNTPSANGLAGAIEELDQFGRSNANKYLIFFSDGMANRPLANIPDSNIDSLIESSCGDSRCSRGCPQFPCFDAVRGVGCRPYDGGSCCTNDAVLQGELARGELDISIPYDYDYTVYSIFLENIPLEWLDYIECNSDFGGGSGNQQALEMAIKLGRDTMEAIANPPSDGQEYFFATDDVNDLVPIFEEIAASITKAGGLKIMEVPPEEN